MKETNYEEAIGWIELTTIQTDCGTCSLNSEDNLQPSAVGTLVLNHVQK